MIYLIDLALLQMQPLDHLTNNLQHRLWATLQVYQRTANVCTIQGCEARTKLKAPNTVEEEAAIYKTGHTLMHVMV